MFELQCLALRKDAKMYKDRIEAVLQQMEEVSIERDQVGESKECAGVFIGAADFGAVVKAFFIYLCSR